MGKSLLLIAIQKVHFAANAKVNKLLDKENPSELEIALALKTTKPYKENQNGIKDLADKVIEETYYPKVRRAKTSTSCAPTEPWNN